MDSLVDCSQIRTEDNRFFQKQREKRLEVVGEAQPP